MVYGVHQLLHCFCHFPIQCVSPFVTAAIEDDDETTTANSGSGRILHIVACWEAVEWPPVQRLKPSPLVKPPTNSPALCMVLHAILHQYSASIILCTVAPQLCLYLILVSIAIYAL